jgi:hypothetical protein
MKNLYIGVEVKHQLKQKQKHQLKQKQKHQLKQKQKHQLKIKEGSKGNVVPLKTT